jgi:SAM-dependent methyltransferase
MDLKERYYSECRFGGLTAVDGTAAFYVRVNSLITASSVVLDVGCGRGAYADDAVAFRRNLRIVKGKCPTVIGIDVDRGAAQNPFLDEFRLIESATWPVSDQYVDLCICDHVLEHIEDPTSFFGECRRVLRPGGYLCIRTPNLCSYFGVISRLIPNRYHAKVAARVQSDRKSDDVFPVLYRCNTLWGIRRMLTLHGFEHRVFGHEAEPSYLSFSRALYCLAVLHQRLAPSFVRVTLFAFARKL